MSWTLALAILAAVPLALAPPMPAAVTAAPATAPALAAPVAPAPMAPPGNAACGECHAAADPTVDTHTYNESAHGLLSCVRCHSEAAGPAHAAQPAAPLGVPAGRAGLAAYSERCRKCHAAIEPSYDRSFHGIAVGQGDHRAATCVDCHGVHNVFAAGDDRSTVAPDRVVATCAQPGCHPGAPAGFAAGPEHVDPTAPGPGSARWLHWIWKFFIGLILFDVMKDGPIVMFDLLRRVRG